MHKNYPGTHTAGTIKSKFKGSFENCIVSENVFLFMSAIEDHQHTRNSFYVMYHLWLTILILKKYTIF